MPVIFNRGGDVFEVFQGNGTFRVQHKGVDILDFRVTDETPVPDPVDPPVDPDPAPTPDPVPVPTPPPAPTPTPTPVPSGTVSGASELMAALNAATSGEVIALAPGNYGVLTINNIFASTVTLTSADPNNRAVIAGLRMSGAGNVRFTGLAFEYVQNGEANSFQVCGISNSRNIAFDGNDFIDRDAADLSKFGNGKALSFADCANIAVEGNTFAGFWKGILSARTTEMYVAGNDISGYRSDGMMFNTSADHIIDGNHVHDARRPAGNVDHGDGIQFDNSTHTNPVVTDNRVKIGNGDYHQMIFCGGHVINGLFAGNDIEGNHKHGVSIASADGLKVLDNVLNYKFAGLSGNGWYPIILIGGGSVNVEIGNNESYGEYHIQPSWNVYGSVIKPKS